MSQLDPGQIDELRDVMGDDFPDLIRTFLDDSIAQRVALVEAVHRGDAEGLRRQAHGLKGACLNLGAGAIAQLCAVLEAHGAAADTASAEPLLVAFEVQYAALRDELQSLR